MTFCSSSKVAVFSLLTIDVDLCLNMSEDLNQIWNVGKSLLEITAYQMKSVINKDIIKAVTDGIESLCNIPVKLFWDCLMEFNRGRNRALRTRLRNISVSYTHLR